ncbi:uncharacterized protein LOC133205082 [Saccostrea echinata]|uniref:uncharacterized protein LOC133205082 n=1 Tax=Saccostrea echinata TaxID=191078 RepID=UPI002A80BF53|nr:uncharacterized protein LOC133205082 [Saccostrea echinata]
MAQEDRRVSFANADDFFTVDHAETFNVSEGNHSPTPQSSCEICEEKVPAIWICMDCDQNLCEKCKNAHLKSRASVNCNVVSIFMKKKYAFDENSCLFHPREISQQFCRSCNRTVCSKCIALEHNRHNYVDLDEVVREKKANLHKRLDRLRKQDLPEIRIRTSMLQKNQEEYSKSVQNLIHEIYKRHEIWKRKAEEIRDKVLRDIKKTEKDDMETMRRVRNSLEKSCSEMELLLENLEKEIDVKSDRKCVNFCDNAEKKIDRLVVPKKLDPPKPPKFVTMAFSTSLMTRQFGLLEPHIKVIKPKPEKTKVPSPEVKRRVVKNRLVTIVYTLQTPWNIFSVCPVGKGTAWIGAGHSDKSVRNGSLFLVDVDGNTTMTLKTGYNPLSLTVTKSGNLLFCSGFRCRLVDFNNSGKITIFNDKATYTKGVTTTKDDDVLVSYVNEGKIIRMTPNGKILETIENDNKGHKLVESPLSVKENTNGDIYVINGVSGKYLTAKGKELVCLSDGKIKFKYYGNTTTQASSKPTFSDISCDKKCNIFISDYHNDCVHMLDKDGRFLRFVGTREDGIINPEGIAIDNKGNLMLCSQNHLIYIENY